MNILFFIKINFLIIIKFILHPTPSIQKYNSLLTYFHIPFRLPDPNTNINSTELYMISQQYKTDKGIHSEP